MLRPGFLGSHNVNPFGGLFDKGGGGKADFEPPPEAPPPPPSMEPDQFTEVEMPDGSLYHQDKRCSEGQKITGAPCEGAGCEPGEIEHECADDPEFEKLIAKAAARQKAREADVIAAEQRDIQAQQAAVQRQHDERLRAIQREDEEVMIKQYVTLGVAGVGLLTLGVIFMKVLR